MPFGHKSSTCLLYFLPFPGKRAFDSGISLQQIRIWFWCCTATGIRDAYFPVFLVKGVDQKVLVFVVILNHASSADLTVYVITTQPSLNSILVKK